MANKWLSECWIQEKLLKPLQVRKELVEVSKEIDKVKDKKTLIEFCKKVAAIKNLSKDEIIAVAMLDPRLALEGEEYVKFLEEYDFEDPSVYFKPLVYINTIGLDYNDEIYRQRALEEDEKKNKGKKPDESSSETTDETSDEYTGKDDKGKKNK